MTDGAHDRRNGAVNGREWRDPTPAQLARLEPDKVKARKALARRLLGEGKTTMEIMTAARQADGMSIGAGTIGRVREEMAQDAKREERRKARELKATTVKVKPKPVAEVTQWVRLDRSAGAQLLAAGVPFVFDGVNVSFKAGAK
jgi:hypothetical protein